MPATSSVLVGTPRARLAYLLAALIAVAVTLGVISLPLGPNLSQAARALQSPPTLTYPGEHGQPVGHCNHTGLFGLFGSTDNCTLTFRSGDSYRCTVTSATDEAGLAVGCASHPTRPG